MLTELTVESGGSISLALSTVNLFDLDQATKIADD